MQPSKVLIPFWMICICLISTTALLQAEDSELFEARPPIDRAKLERLARRVEPDLQGQVQRVAQYIEFFRQQLANDSRLFAFQVSAQVVNDQRVKLDGYVEFPETRDALLAYLEVLSITIDSNSIRTLPADSLGERRYGFVTATHRFSMSEPGRGETVTECLYAEPVYLLDEVDS
ncbi:MAG: hypothetical protein AAF394_00805, partial [Planctomycetota bacterium]